MPRYGTVGDEKTGMPRYLPIALTMAALLVGGISAAHLQTDQGNCRYFAETGHYVCDEFAAYYDERGGVEIFGYPLTEAFNDLTHDGLYVQYFQRARMEWHPYNPDPYKVQLGLLGAELTDPFPPAHPEDIPASNSTLHQYFPETNHVVSFEFLRFYHEKGGLDTFGYPISEKLFEDGYLVQYFQRARLEWHPEIVSGSQMRVTNLGERYIERFELPGDYDQPLPAPRGDSPVAPADAAITRLTASASVLKAITAQQDRQVVYVYVRDQRRQSLEGALARIIIHYPSGDQTCEPGALTDTKGFVRCSFDVGPTESGRKVLIDVAVTYGTDLSTTTQTFFLPWW